MELSQWMASFLEWFNLVFEWKGTTPAAITLSALIASLAILSARDTTKRKNSIDILFEAKHDLKFITGVDKLRDIHLDANDEVRRYAESIMRNDIKAKSIRYVLNFFEHISIGIKQDIYDEKIIKISIKQMMVSGWEQALPYIERRRRSLGWKQAYTELQKLIWRWTTPWWKKPLTMCHKIPHITS